MLSIKQSDINYGCYNCRHLNPDCLTCPAYPDGIPEEILSGRVMHKEIRKEQNGSIIFEASTNRIDKICIWKVIKLLSDKKYKTKNKSFQDGLLFAIKTIMEVYRIKKPTN